VNGKGDNGFQKNLKGEEKGLGFWCGSEQSVHEGNAQGEEEPGDSSY